MSTIVCAISGQAPEEPVYSPKTGYVYEKRLILKHIESMSKCPVTKEDVSKEELFEIKANKVVRPRPASAASIPGMLSLLQSEWDALMAESFELKSHLDSTRKQLSHALYQHDAACRVIARLLRERDLARAQVVTLQDQMSNMTITDTGMQEDEGETGLTPELLERITDIAKSLTRTRKNRHFPNLTPVADVERFACIGSYPVHHSTAPGILCLDVHKADENRIVTGGIDQQVILFDAKKERTVQKLLGHSKKVGSVMFHPTKDIVLSASQDASARVWTCTDPSSWKGPYTCAYAVNKHRADVTDVSVHPLGDLFVTCSLDKSWAFHDLNTGRCIRHMKDHQHGYTCMKFHPDGQILVGGAEDNSIVIWNVKEESIVASLSGPDSNGHQGVIQALSFSENGYHLASGSRDGTVKLWDLRKPLNFQTLQISDGPINAVRFDETGQYVAVGANSVKIFNFVKKSFVEQTLELMDHDKSVTGVCFGTNAAMLASVSMDRTLRLYRPGDKKS